MSLNYVGTKYTQKLKKKVRYIITVKVCPQGGRRRTVHVHVRLLCLSLFGLNGWLGSVSLYYEHMKTWRECVDTAGVRFLPRRHRLSCVRPMSPHRPLLSLLVFYHIILYCTASSGIEPHHLVLYRISPVKRKRERGASRSRSRSRGRSRSRSRSRSPPKKR